MRGERFTYNTHDRTKIIRLLAIILDSFKGSLKNCDSSTEIRDLLTDIVSAVTEPRPVEKSAAGRGGWQPIETAPKSKVDRLLVCEGAGWVFIGYYNYGWVAHGNCTTKSPTHWMPLPEPPKKGDEDE